MKRSVMCLALLAMVAVWPRTSAADEIDPQALYKKAVKSCVFIVTPMKGGMGMGSGSLIDVEKRIVLTNYHVVDDRDIVFVQFPMYQKNGEMITDKEAYFANVPANKAIKGKVLHRDKSRDLAFVQVEKIPPGTDALPLAHRSIGVGAAVWNIGSPGDVKHVFSVTEGKVRGVGTQKLDFGDQIVNAMIVTTTNPVNQGDSGGPLIDKRGYQVAVTQSILLKAQLVSHFVDITEVHAFLSAKKIYIKDLAGASAEKPMSKEVPKVSTPLVVKPDPPVVVPMPKKEIAPAAADPAKELEATELLRRSKLFSMGEDNLPIYKAKLQDIIKKYPATEAAKEAKKIVDGLK